MKFGNRSSPNRVVAAHSVHNRCRFEPSGIVPRPWHPRIRVPGDVGKLLFIRCNLKSYSTWSARRWTSLWIRRFTVAGVLTSGVFVGLRSELFAVASCENVVRSSKLQASVSLIAVYRLMNPPTDSSCTSSSCLVLRKHTTFPGSSWTRKTFVWFRHISGFGVEGTITFVVGLTYGMEGFVVPIFHGRLYLDRLVLLVPVHPRDIWCRFKSFCSTLGSLLISWLPYSSCG